MPTNQKPALTVLVDGVKRDKFSALCAKHNRPMAWAINGFIDQCLVNDAIVLAPNESINYLPSRNIEAGEVAELREMMAGIKEDLKLIGGYKPRQDVTGVTEMQKMMAEIKESLQRIGVYVFYQDASGVKEIYKLKATSSDETLTAIQQNARAEVKRLLEESLKPQLKPMLSDLFTVAGI